MERQDQYRSSLQRIALICLFFGSLTAARGGPPYDCCHADSVFGNGSSSVVITEDTVLEADTDYHDLTVSSGVTLDTAGHRIRVCGKLTNYGTITDRVSGGLPGAGGAGGLGANPLQDVVPDDCGPRQVRCTAGAAGQAGGPPAIAGAGAGGQGGGGGGAGGGALRGTYDADGGNGGAGGSGGRGGGYVQIYAFLLENWGVIHADGSAGEPGQNAPVGYDTCGPEYEAWPPANPTNDLAGGGGGGGGGGSGGNGGTVELHCGSILRFGEIHAHGGPGAPGGAGAPPGGTVLFGAPFGSAQEGCASASNGGAGGRGSCAPTIPPTAGQNGAPGPQGAAGRVVVSLEICGYALTDLGTAGGASSRAEGLNEHGLVAGYIRTGGRSHAVLWVNGYPVPLEPDGYPAN